MEFRTFSRGPALVKRISQVTALLGNRKPGCFAPRPVLPNPKTVPLFGVLIDAFLAAVMLTSPRRPSSTMRIFLFGRMVPTGISTDVPDCFLRTVRYALACLSHRCSSLGLR